MKPLTSDKIFSIRKNTTIGILISGIGYLFPALAFIYIARILTPEGLGRLSFVSSVTAYFVLFVGLGMPNYGLRAVAEQRQSKESLSRLSAELMLIRIITGILVWVVYLFVIRLTVEKDGTLYIISGFSILISILDCTWLFKGMEEYASRALVSSAVRMFGFLATIFLIRQASDIRTYAWISVLIPLAIFIAELAIAEQKWHLHIGSQCVRILATGGLFQAIQKHIRLLLLFLLMSCAVTIYGHTDTVMLGLMKDEQTVGLYTCAAKIKMLLPVLTGTLWVAALPRSASLWKRKQTYGFVALSEELFHVVYMVMLPLTVYFFIFAESWVDVLGGEAYIGAVQTMRILLLAIMPIGISNIVGGQMLIPMGQEKKLFQAEAIAAVGNIAMNAILIPIMSASGAALATVICEVFVAIFVGCSVLKQVKVRIIQTRKIRNSLIGCGIAGLSSFLLFRILSIPVYLKAILSFVLFVLLFSLLMILFRDSLFSSLWMICRRIVPRPIRSLLRKALVRTRMGIYRARTIANPGKTKYYCPCCGIRLRSFVEGKFRNHPERYNRFRYDHTQQDVLCPVCSSVSRHRILASWCDDHRKELRTAKILYFAPEDSMMLWMKRNQVSCTTADLYTACDLKLDIQATGLPDESWDVVICNHVLEHVEDFRLALKELHRILKPHGYLICSFPMDPKVDLLEEAEGMISEAEQIQRFGQIDHKRVFGMKADQLLEEAGFTVERISGEDYPDEILPVVGPADYDINCLFKCGKE